MERIKEDRPITIKDDKGNLNRCIADVVSVRPKDGDTGGVRRVHAACCGQTSAQKPGAPRAAQHSDPSGRGLCSWERKGWAGLSPWAASGRDPCGMGSTQPEAPMHPQPREA